MYGYGLDCFSGMGSFGWFGIIFNLILLIGLIVGFVVFIVWLVRKSSSNNQALASAGSQGNVAPSAREILEMRYARGEITREQYQTMKEDIG